MTQAASDTAALLQAIDLTVEGQDTVSKADSERIRATVVNLPLNPAQAMAGRDRLP